MTQFITVIIVVIPEGLPLVITLSLAYSVNLMRKDGILIKNLNSPEVNATINHILIGKTGTLTKGDLSVCKFYIQERTIENSRPDTIFNSKLNEKVIDLLEESIVFNSDARIEINSESKFEPIGNPTEVALLQLLQAANEPIQHLIKTKFESFQDPSEKMVPRV